MGSDRFRAGKGGTWGDVFPFFDEAQPPAATLFSQIGQIDKDGGFTRSPIERVDSPASRASLFLRDPPTVLP